MYRTTGIKSIQEIIIKLWKEGNSMAEIIGVLTMEMSNDEKEKDQTQESIAKSCHIYLHQRCIN